MHTNGHLQAGIHRNLSSEIIKEDDNDAPRLHVKVNHFVECLCDASFEQG